MIKHYYYCFNCSVDHIIKDVGKFEPYCCPNCNQELFYSNSQEIDEQTGNITNKFIDAERRNFTQHISDKWKDRVYARAANNSIPKCPTCQSTNIRKMGGVERGASIWAFGLFSKKINKTFKCNNCGYTW